MLLDSLLDDVAVTVPSAATEVEVDSEAEAVVEASAETLVDVVVVAVVALASAAGVSWAMEISGATPRAATKPAAAMMRTEAFMVITFSVGEELLGLMEFCIILYKILNAEASRRGGVAFDKRENSVRLGRKFVASEVYL